MRRPFTRLLQTSAFALVLTSLAAPAIAAATFDEATGRLTLAGADYGVSFDTLDSLDAGLEAEFLDEDGNPIDPATLGGLFVNDPNGLEGDGALELGGARATLNLLPQVLDPDFAGRRVEVRLWQRPLGTRMTITLTWVIAGTVDPDQQAVIAHFPFQPTGRVTSDGWEEWSSGPVDWTLAGSGAPGLIRLEDVQVRRAEWQYITFDRSLRVLVDALEVIDLGPALVPDATCSLPNREQDCGPDGACLFGRCVDATLRYGPTLRDDVLRSEYLDRRLFEFSTFEGSRMAQGLISVLAGTADTLRGETSPARFWPGLRGAVNALRDGHASAPLPAFTAAWGVTNLGVCVHYGDADLLPTPGPAPLVFSIEASNPVADLLAVGDALVEIDGLPPYEWATVVGMRAGSSGDPAQFEVVGAPRLMTSANLAGSRLTFARCARTGPNPTPCTQGELEMIEVDFGQIAQDEIWSGTLPGWLGDSQRCDYRFLRGVDDPNVKGYSFAGYQDDGPIRTLIINGVPSPFSGNGPAWWSTVTEALDPAPQYLIFDQRTGGGGAIDTTDYIMGLLLTEQDFDRMEILPLFGRNLDQQLWSLLESCGQECGSYFRWSLHEMSDMDPALRGVAANTRVAVLNALDVSGNDFTSKLFTYRSGATRIFAANPTAGAFGPIAGLAPLFDELSGGSMQFWDTQFIPQPAGPAEDFATGIGIPPDEPVLQRQSDALQGIDTTIEAAKAWLLLE